MMTPEELLEDIETCTGPCGRLCLSCPESRYLEEIHDVLKNLIEENNKFRRTLAGQTGEVDYI